MSTINFTGPTSVAQLAERASALLDEGSRLAMLASHLAEYEEATGRQLFVSEADQGTLYVGTPDEIVPDGAAVPHLDTGQGQPIKKVAPAPAGFEVQKAPADQEPVKKPETLKAAPRRQPLKAPTDRPWGALSLAERRIVQHVERLPDTFTPEDDLKLVEMLAHGNKIGTVAALLEVEPAVALDRWQAFMCDDVVGLDRKPTITGQAALLKALRYRAEVGA